MPDKNDNQTPDTGATGDDKTKQPVVNEELEKLVQERLQEALKPVKEKLDKAYSARDEALKKAAEFEAKEREEQLKRLQEEGKHKEAYEMQLAEERTKRELLEKQNLELTRDMELRNALAAHQFRNDNATSMAYREIVSQLVRNESGQWVHRSGVPMRDFVKTFVESDDNAFLLKPKTSSGGGTSTVKPTQPDEKKSLFSMSQEEVLKRAREGSLRRA